VPTPICLTGEEEKGAAVFLKREKGRLKREVRERDWVLK